MTLAGTGEAYSAASAVLWAVAVVLFRQSGETVAPGALNLFKNSVGLVLLCATMLILGTPLFPKGSTGKDWAVLLASGVVGIAAADTLFFASLNRLGAGRSAIVDCLYSPLVILCAFVYLDEPIGPALAGAAVLIGGAIFVGTWQPEGPGRPTREMTAGIAYGVVSMALMAASIVVAKPVIERVDPLWATTVRMAGAFPVLMLQGAFPRQRAQVRQAFTPGPHWKAMLPATFVGAYLALIVWVAGFKYAAAGVAGVLNQTSTLLVLFFATVFLREPLSWRRGAAIAMGFAGAVLAVR